MIGPLERLVRPLLQALEPEDAHALTLRMLKFAPPLGAVRDDRRLAIRAFGLNFPNPVGMAAGFDKNAEVPDVALEAMIDRVGVANVLYAVAHIAAAKAGWRGFAARVGGPSW